MSDNIRILFCSGPAQDSQRMTELLAAAGYDVLSARDTTAAWDRMAAFKPDVVILAGDPDPAQGPDVLSRVKASPLLEDISIVIISQDGRPEAIAEAIDRGADDCLAWPVEAGELIARVGAVIRKGRRKRRLQADMDVLFQWATVDPLTGLYNRQYFRPVLERYMASFRRYHRRFALFMLDVDDLRTMNERHGRSFGDEALKAVGRLLKQQVRATDLAVRYGGEEFSAVMPETGLGGAVAMAERVRKNVEDLRLSGAGESRITMDVEHRRGDGCREGLRPDSGRRFEDRESLQIADRLTWIRRRNRA